MKSPMPWKKSGCALALSYYSFCEILHRKCLIGFWILLCLDNYSITCTVTLCYVLHETHTELCLLRYMQAYSSIFNIIEVYSHKSRHYYKTYSASSVTFHIHNLAIFWALAYEAYSKLWNFDQAYLKPCHSQNSLFRHYSTIFRHI